MTQNKQHYFLCALPLRKQNSRTLEGHFSFNFLENYMKYICWADGRISPRHNIRMMLTIKPIGSVMVV